MSSSLAAKIRWIGDDEQTADESIQVAEISQACFGQKGWTPYQVQQFATTLNHIPKVLSVDGRVAGYLFYVLRRRVIEIRQFAVREDLRRQGWGRRLLQHLLRIQPSLRRDKIVCEVPGHHVEAQVFLREHGFRWFRTRHQHTDDETYLMRYVRKEES